MKISAICRTLYFRVTPVKKLLVSLFFLFFIVFYHSQSGTMGGLKVTRAPQLNETLYNWQYK